VTEQISQTTQDTLLGGRVTIVQPKDGYRVAIDPILLAASIQPEAGDSILDVGAGTGAVSLCLAERCPDVTISGLELNEQYCAWATQSAALNGLAISFHHGDLFSPPNDLQGQLFSFVLSNPPYWSPESSRPTSPSRSGAHFLDGVSLTDWIRQCLALLQNGGILSLVLPAEKLDEALGALAVAAGGIKVFPLWARTGEPAKRIILQAKKQSKAPLRLYAGLSLHAAGGGFTTTAQHVLNDGEPLSIA